MRRIGEFTVERRGAGGMGVVYLARTAAGRRVALKVIRPEYADEPQFRARFRREVAAARKVSGAFTAPVVDADPDGDPPWLATQYVAGDSLEARVRSGGPLPAADVVRLAGQLAEALRDIHRQGIVHRDLKPANVLLADDGVRVIDFGIARSVVQSRALTRSGAMVGTPAYMAPEQLIAATFTDTFRHRDLEDGRAIMMYDALLTAARAVRETPAVPHPTVTDVHRMLARLRVKGPLPGASGWIALGSDGRPQGQGDPGPPDRSGRPHHRPHGHIGRRHAHPRLRGTPTPAAPGGSSTGVRAPVPGVAARGTRPGGAQPHVPDTL